MYCRPQGVIERCWSRRQLTASSSGQLLLEHPIVTFVHAESGIGRLRVLVVALDVEAQSTDVGTLLCLMNDIPIQGAEHAMAALLWRHVHALNPPPPGVAPVAPFVGNHQATCALVIAFRDSIEAACAIGQHRVNARLQSFARQFELFRFQRHLLVAVNEKVEIVEGGRSGVGRLVWLGHGGTVWDGVRTVGRDECDAATRLTVHSGDELSGPLLRACGAVRAGAS